MKFYAILLLAFLHTTLAPAQNAADSNKYKIELPAFWKKSGATYRHFDTALQHHFPAIAGKRICTMRCNARYVVKLVVTEPVFEDPVANNFVTGGSFIRYDLLIPYHFTAMLVFLDASGRKLDSIPLVDSVEVHVMKQVVQNKVDFANIPEIEDAYNGTKGDLRRQSAERRAGQGAEQAAALRAQAANEAPPVLTKRKIDRETYMLEMYAIIDQRFRSIR